MQPWTFFLTAVAGWMNGRQQEATEFRGEGDKALGEQLGDVACCWPVAERTG